MIVVDRARARARRFRRPGLAGATATAAAPRSAARSSGRPTQGERHSDLLDEDLLFTAVPVAVGRPRGRRGAGDPERRRRERASSATTCSRSSGVGAVALLLGLAVAWLLAGSLAKPLRSLAGDGAARGPRRSRRARERGGLRRAAGGGHRLQRHDRSHGEHAARAARLRGERVAPAAHPAHRPAAAPRGGGAQEPRPRGRARARPRPSTRPSGSRGSCPSCSRSPAAASGPRRSRSTWPS